MCTHLTLMMGTNFGRINLNLLPTSLKYNGGGRLLGKLTRTFVDKFEVEWWRSAIWHINVNLCGHVLLQSKTQKNDLKTSEHRQHKGIKFSLILAQNKALYPSIQCEGS